MDILCDFNFDTKDFVNDLRAEHIVIYRSKDDPAEPFTQSQMYKLIITHAKIVKLEGKGHCNLETFPEVIAEVKSLT